MDSEAVKKIHALHQLGYRLVMRFPGRPGDEFTVVDVGPESITDLVSPRYTGICKGINPELAITNVVVEMRKAGVKL